MPLPEYRSLEQRLADWQRGELTRQRRPDMVEQVVHHDYHGRNLLARPGVSVHVDSYLGTVNTDRPEDIYTPLYEVVLSWQPGPSAGWLTVQLAVDGPNLAATALAHNGVPVTVRGTTAVVQLVPGANVLVAQARSAAGYHGRPSRLEFAYDRSPEWPAGLRLTAEDNGRIAPGRYTFGHEVWPEPTLIELRQRFELDRLVAGAATDLERAVRLRDWVKSLWTHRLPWRHPIYNGLLILDRASRGVDTLICMHYSVALIHCCLSLGLPARLLNLHRGIAPSYAIGFESKRPDPIDEHVIAEVYCSELRKWVMMDCDFDYHYERAGVPLNAWEIHQAFLNNETSALTVCPGPGAAGYAEIGLGTEFYQHKIPAYYAHFTIMLRNDFLSDPTGPVPALHLTDALTPPILWYRGEDMRFQPYMLGPLVVATPYTDATPLITDGNLDSAWASEDSPQPHWFEVRLPAPTALERFVIHWPDWRNYYRTSRAYTLEACVDGRWQLLLEVRDNPERPWTVHDLPAPLTVQGLRLTQPPGGGCAQNPHRLWVSQIEAY